MLGLAWLPTWVACGDDPPPPPEPAPEAGIAPLGLNFLDEEDGPELTQTLFLANVGDAPMSVNSIVLAGPDGMYTISTPDLPFALQPRASAEIVVTYAAPTCFENHGDITIVTSASDDPIIVALRPDARAGDVIIAPDPLEFGEVSVGSSTTQRMTIRNPGSCVFSLQDVALAGTTDIRFVGVEDDGEELQFLPMMPRDLGAGETLDVDIAYSPTSSRISFSTLQVISDHPRREVITASVFATGVQ